MDALHSFRQVNFNPPDIFAAFGNKAACPTSPYDIELIFLSFSEDTNAVHVAEEAMVAEHGAINGDVSAPSPPFSPGVEPRLSLTAVAPSTAAIPTDTQNTPSLNTDHQETVAMESADATATADAGPQGICSKSSIPFSSDNFH
ncbi:unnamed protein product [Dibothriocephalus latus]|uniref:Uncharacterized protein n=1 Tax=Dibothriocephalus latus TaxID=60516 RepID=A0A3P7M325_DIBLA|nr:unnamed protein product [Dibothriocephalus latus]